MQLATLAMLVQDAAAENGAADASSPALLTSSLEGILGITLWMVPIVLAALAAVAPQKSQRFYPLLLPGFMVAIFLTMMSCGRMFFAGYLLAEGDMGTAMLSSEDSMRFTTAAAVAYSGLFAASITAVLSMVAAYRTEGMAAALSWAALIVAGRYASDGISSVFDLFAGDPSSERLEATEIAQSQMDAWASNPLMVAVCLTVFLILRFIGSKTNAKPA